MTIDITNITSGNAAGGTTNNTASISRVAGRIYLICVAATKSASTDPVVPTVSGTGITQLDSITNLFTSTGTNRRRITIVIVRADTTGSNVMTIAHSSAPTRLGWVVDEATDVDTTTPHVVANEQIDNGASSANAFIETITMSDHDGGRPGDRYYSVIMGNVAAATIRGELDSDKVGTTNSVDWEDLGTANNTSAPVLVLRSFWNDESVRKDLSPGWVSASGLTWGQIAIELRQAAAVQLPYWGISAL